MSLRSCKLIECIIDEAASNLAALDIITVSGKITSNRGQGLLGANILVVGTSIGAATDLNGKYSIDLLKKSEIPTDGVWCLFVIGHYTGKVSYPEKIPEFIEKMKANNVNFDWAICAFAKEEMSCLEKAVSLGGKIRVGFENSIFMPDGEIAPDNHSKIKAVNKLFNLS